MFSRSSKILKTNSGASSVAVDHNLLLGPSGDGRGAWQRFAGRSGAGPAVPLARSWRNGHRTSGQTFAIVGLKVVLKLTENASAASDFGVLSVLTTVRPRSPDPAD